MRECSLEIVMRSGQPAVAYLQFLFIHGYGSGKATASFFSSWEGDSLRLRLIKVVDVFFWLPYGIVLIRIFYKPREFE